MIRNILLAGMLAAISASPAISAEPAPAATQAAAYSTASTDLGTLLGNPETKAVLQKHVPELVAHDQIQMVSGMTLKTIQGMKPDAVSEEVLARIDADLAKIPAKK